MSSQLVPRFEFGHFHKFLVSLGLVFFLAALAVPWFVLRESDALRVSTSELAGLTETGRSTIERKQESLSTLVTIWPYVSLVLLIGGIALVAFGLFRWRQRQAVYDRMEDLNRAKLEDEVRNLTPVEVSDKIDRETQEQQVEVAVAVGQEASSPPADEVRQRHEDFRRRVLEVEATAATKLGEALERSHEIRTNLAVRSKSGRAELDIVAKARARGGLDIVVEVKNSRIGIPSGLGDWILRAATGRQIYSEATNRDAGALLWLVGEDPERFESRRELIEQRVLQFGQLVTPAVPVLIHTREQLEALPPAELRAELHQVFGGSLMSE
jgi:hypothetical protein